MQSDEGGERRAPNVRRYIAAFLMLYGAVGVAVNLRLLLLIAEGLRAWFGLPAPSDAPAGWDLFSPLQTFFDSLPWLPWAAWLIGFWILDFGFWIRFRIISSENPKLDPSLCSRSKIQNPKSRGIAIAVIVVLVLVGGYARMVELWPESMGLSQFPYDDEGVYAGASQLFLQGILPYKDYFFAHPPIAAISYAPALAYHFTEWGSPNSFMNARYLSVAYSLATLTLIFLIGRQLAGIWGGAIAGALWALDGRVIEINRKVMLDGPMVLLSCGALLVYLLARAALREKEAEGSEDTNLKASRKPLILLLFAGALGGMSGLTKIAGAACLLAILADMIWIHFDNRRSQTASYSLWKQLGSLLGGALAAVLLFVGPFLIAAPSQFIRNVVFFQLLRPSDGLIDVPARIGDITASYANALTPMFAALGFIAVTLWVWSVVSAKFQVSSFGFQAFRTIVLWTFFSLLLFTYSRSFYGHYYIQLAAPLCLLGAGAALLPRLVMGLLGQGRNKQRPYASRWAGGVMVAALVVISLPYVVVAWNGANGRHEDRIFEIVGRYVSDAIPPDTEALTTDEQFNFLAARPPSRNGTGYLVDSYGHMISLGLGLDRRDWGDLISAAIRGEHGNDVYAVLQLPTAQGDFLDRAFKAPLIVLHQKGLPRLTDATIGAIELRSKVVEQEPRYTIYRNER